MTTLDKYIIVSTLTSEKKGTIKLSKDQPKVISQSTLTSNSYKYGLYALKDSQDNKESIVSPEDTSHLVVVAKQFAVIELDGKFFIIGKLTSKDTGFIISEEQFKPYQDKKKYPDYVDKKLKTQFLKRNEHAEEISPDNLIPLKGSVEYLEQNEKGLTELNNAVKDLSKKPVYLHQHKVHSKETGIQACKNHDLLVEQGKPQPLSKFQIKKNEEAKQKQDAEKPNKNNSKPKNKHEV